MRLALPDPTEARPDTQAILEAVRKQLGFVPNLYRVMSISPATLSGWAGFMGALGDSLDARTRHAISLAVSDANGCEYCVVAHSHVAANLGNIAPDEVARNREGRSQDAKREAATRFARQLAMARGKVTQAEFEAVRAAGYSDAQVVEVIALTAQFSIANLLNNAVKTDIDFPVAELTDAA